MKLQIANYKTISEHFKQLTGNHCEFVQDLKTLYLKIDGVLYKTPRFEEEVENNMDVETLMKSYISIFEEIFKKSRVN